MAELAIIGVPMSQEQTPGAASNSEETQPEQGAEYDLYRAARLLLDIAGDGQAHIVMNTNPAIPKKYVTVHRPLTLADMRSHLQGRRLTLWPWRGAWLLPRPWPPRSTPSA